ncbi:MAG: PKD domain-containing protein [Chitinophagaceae bacterium]|nr:PKD domain-containing protein [Chitinophagaceae bacterium]
MSNLPGPPPQPPISIYATCVPGPGGPDSTTVVNGKTLYWYSLPLSYILNTAGVYTVTITTFSPNTDGCGTEQEFDFDLTVYDPPAGSFTWTTSNGCSTQPVQFTETTPQIPKTTYQFWWDFGDPASGPANNSTLRNPTHLFSGGGTYTVSYVGITTPGCLLDTIRHQVTVNDAPVADFAVTGPFCVNDPITFTDNSIPGPSATINKWTWDFGDGSPPVVVFAPNPPNQIHPYALPGTYNATLQVETTTGCPSVVFTRQVIIGDNGTLTLTSAPGTDNQVVCINSPITDITYAVGGGGTGGSVSGLPAGVTGTFAGGVITITGTPTVSGTFNYTVTSTGACVNPVIAGIITVNDNGTLTLISAPGTDNQTVCINTPIVAINYAVGGSGTGGSVSGLPAGVTGTFAGGVITISGAPTVSGTFIYTVTTTGPCIVPTATGRIIVTDDGTLTLTSAPGTDNQTVCINTPITNITYAVGGTGTGGSVSGLPAGVTGTFVGGIITITGTPTVSGTFNYSVTTTGPCAAPSANGTITVSDNGTLTLISAPGTDIQTVCINTPIVVIIYAVGGSGTGGSVSGLPAGVTGTFAGGVITITGAPTVSGTFNYTVTTTGPCIVPTANGRITVTDDGTLTLTSAPGTDNQTVCINTPITTITYAVGGTGTGGSVSGLPVGVTGTFAGGVITITGTPTVSGTFNYSVTTTGPCAAPSANGTINVTDNGTLTLISAPGTDIQTVCINTPIVAIIYAVGGSGTGGSVSGLPAGVTGTFAGGVITITGSPSVSGTFNYTVTTTGPCIIPTANGRITVTDDGTLTLTSAPGTNNQTVCINTPIINITYAVGGTGTGGSVSGLPAGVTGTYAGGVITITGTPTVSGTFNYTVTTTGPCAAPSANGTITVSGDGTITLTSAAGTDNQNACINLPIIPITYAVGGSGTGGSVSGLPAGVTGTFAGGVITIAGAPSVSGTFNYTVTTTGPCVTPTATGTITVTSVATITLTSGVGTDNQTVCINVPITNITYLVGGSGTGGNVTGLPTGVTGSFAGGVVTISGIPTAVGTFNYIVNTTGPCGTPTANGTITVNDNSTLSLSSGPGSNVQTVCINTAITNITYAVGGGGTGASITAGSLPAGVSGSYSGGVFTISGTPTVSGIFNFTITTAGPCINPTASGTITVTADGTLTLTSAPGTTNQTVCINTPIVNITYAVGGTWHRR